MSEQVRVVVEGEKPELYRHRMLEQNGKLVLAYDFARKGGTPVAVTGPNAVECNQCRAGFGEPCRGIDGRDGYAHFARLVEMNKKIAELEAKNGK